ncbi:MAG: DUF1858 domain-containing protein [Candidatus Woesearchaeota archaeon]
MVEEYNIFNDDTEHEQESFSLDNNSETKDTITSDSLINKNMMIADVANMHPDVVPILLENGLHCIGCGASEFETIEEGFLGHGISNSEIDKIVDDINNFIRDNK